MFVVYRKIKKKYGKCYYTRKKKEYTENEKKDLYNMKRYVRAFRCNADEKLINCKSK